MQVRLGRTVAIGTILVTLAACGGPRDPKLLNFKPFAAGTGRICHTADETVRSP